MNIKAADLEHDHGDRYAEGGVTQGEQLAHIRGRSGVAVTWQVLVSHPRARNDVLG